MPAVAARLRAQARDRWRAWLALAVLAGLVGGVILATLAGARRTQTAYGRFLARTNAFDVLVSNGGTTPENLNRVLDFEQVARLPDVAAAARLLYYFASGTTPSGRPIRPSDLTPLASPDGQFGTTLNEALLVRGRLPTELDEVALSVLAAEGMGLGVGDRLAMDLTAPAEDEGATFAVPGPAGFRVVGVVAMQGGMPPLTGGLPPPVLLSPAYGRARPGGAEILAVRLKRGVAAAAAFEQEMDRLAGDQQIATASSIDFTSPVERSLGVQASALRILAGAAGVVALLLLTQAFGRQRSFDAQDNEVLRALGVTSTELGVLGAARSAAIALMATVLAAATAVALSPLFPVGVARQAEPQPGIRLEAWSLAVGLPLVALVVFLLGALPLSRPAGRRQAQAAEPSRAVAALARAGFPAPAVSGVRMAFEPGEGRRAVPVRSAVVSMILAVATIVSAVVFSASLARLFDEPHLYGWNWDIQVGDVFSPALEGEIARLDAHPAVEAIAGASIVRLQIGPVRVDALATAPVRGTIAPTISEGRAPSAPDEMVVGGRTLRQAGLSVGDTVDVGFAGRSAPMRIVGKAVLTEFGGSARLGEGAALTLDGLRRLVPEAETDVMLIRLRPGPQATELVASYLADAPGNVYLPFKPSDLTDLERLGGVPSLVAALLGLVALVTLAHALVASVRRRRRDFAVLKVLGFSRGQVWAAVAWQSSAMAVLGVAVGVPVGVVTGRWAWQAFAQWLGVPPEPVAPMVLLMALIPVTLALANVVAALPGRLAARAVPSVGLRAE